MLPVPFRARVLAALDLAGSALYKLDVFQDHGYAFVEVFVSQEVVAESRRRTVLLTGTRGRHSSSGRQPGS
jgi:hypothetical protein